MARHLARYNKNLLQELTNQWHEINPEICINDDKYIEQIKNAMIECLQSLCQKLLYSTLDKIEKQWNYSKQLSTLINEINLLKQPLVVTLSEASNTLKDIKINLITSFKQQLEINMNLTTNSLDVVEFKIDYLIDEWIKHKLYVANKDEVR